MESLDIEWQELVVRASKEASYMTGASSEWRNYCGFVISVFPTPSMSRPCHHS